MVSPPFPMTRPTLLAGIRISWTALFPSIWVWKPGPFRHRSTICPNNLLACLKNTNDSRRMTGAQSVHSDSSRAAVYTVWCLLERAVHSYSMLSGVPVRVQGLSIIPPLSVGVTWQIIARNSKQVRKQNNAGHGLWANEELLLSSLSSCAFHNRTKCSSSWLPLNILISVFAWTLYSFRVHVSLDITVIKLWLHMDQKSKSILILHSSLSLKP